MTEVEWLTCRDTQRMLSFVLPRRPDAGHKALRFAVACLRRTEWRLLPNQLHGLERVEAIADGTAPASFDPASFGFITSEDRPFASRFAGFAWLVCQARKQPERIMPPSVVAREAVELAQTALDPTLAIDTVLSEELARLSEVVRDIFGNPFRLVSLDPSWLSSDVLALARGIYADRAFDGMPILADALQDAGCTNDDVLNHCRDTSLTHVRGCWVVDLLLGKS